ncbi:MAG TPA: hypothetical protein VK789_01955 [Bryobacteraceae bacterium]|nr:hypothetical protein [Bryobacteraceae bacterium]
MKTTRFAQPFGNSSRIITVSEIIKALPICSSFLITASPAAGADRSNAEAVGGLLNYYDRAA